LQDLAYYQSRGGVARNDESRVALWDQ
jgi:hypothetical protein